MFFPFHWDYSHGKLVVIKSYETLINMDSTNISVCVYTYGVQYEMRFGGKRLFGCGQVEFWAQRAEVAAEVW